MVIILHPIFTDHEMATTTYYNFERRSHRTTPSTICAGVKHICKLDRLDHSKATIQHHCPACLVVKKNIIIQNITYGVSCLCVVGLVSGGTKNVFFLHIIIVKRICHHANIKIKKNADTLCVMEVWKRHLVK